LFLGAAFLSAQTVRLDDAIESAAAYFNGQLPQGAKIAVTNIQSDWPDISNYIIEELTTKFITGGSLNPVVRDREQLSRVQSELSFQASGNVSDKTAKDIGWYIGAEMIISGSFKRLGNMYRLSVSAMEVETARFAGMQTYNIHTDSRLAALLRGKGNDGEGPAFFWFLWNSDTSWKDKRLYPGIRAGVSPRDYVLNTTLSNITAEPHSSFEIAALCEVQIFSLFSLQTEIIYSRDVVRVDNPEYGAITVSSNTLSIPLLAKLTARPGIFYLAAFTGPNFVLPLGTMEVTRGGAAEAHDFSPTAGWTVGTDAGMKIGPGLLFLDFRYSGDFKFARSNGDGQYRRNIFSISLGYNYGFINKAGGKVSE
jgi:hypothetical protein